MKKKLFTYFYIPAVMLLGACQNADTAQTATPSSASSIKIEAANETDGGIAQMDLGTQVLPALADVTTAADSEPLAPINLRKGVIHTDVSTLQARLMDLGFMENDDPTTYYGDATSQAVMHFQRQSNMEQDGICGPETWDAIMADNAPHYAASKGMQGDDITRIQQRLYELGYLSSESQITGNFDDVTETAVKKLQGINTLTEDGTVGIQTVNLLYSDEVKANFLALGEKSDLVLEAQKRLKQLGYLSSEPDGTYGQETVNAVKNFQSRNEQVVDGYLGPSTRMVLNSDTAKPYAIRMGEESDTVKQIQKQLSKYGYLSSDKISGYYGELTVNAVQNFQQTNGLTADGTVGLQTMQKLNDGTAKKAVSRPSSGSSSGSSSSSNKRPSSGSSSGSSSSSVGGGGATVSGSASRLISVASSKIGSPYVWGAKGPNSFDCSGFVYWCLNNSGVSVPYMTSSGWRNPGRFQRVSSFSQIQAGDIVVVNGHVGIAAGGGTVIDASSSNGRVVHRSLSSWWRNNFIVAWRIFG